MKIYEFDTEKGVYRFEMGEIETTFHSHPVFEILLSKEGRMIVETPTHEYRNVSFAIIEPNIQHRVIVEKDNLLIVMVECNPIYLHKSLSDFDLPDFEEVFVEYTKKDRTLLMEKIVQAVRQSTVPIAADDRINQCMYDLNHSSLTYKTIIKELASKTHLSDSRLSHLFKDELGISIKKYFVWSKLKRVFAKVVSGDQNMYEASIEVGFFDQAHLSKAFKQMLGIRPSKAYNSRMIQV